MKKIFMLLLMGLVIPSVALSLNPIRNYLSFPVDFGLSYENKLINTPDSCTINTWICFNKEKPIKGTIIFLYGDSGNMSYFLKEIKKLADSGFRVISFDYRGFGHSSIYQIEQNRLFYSEFIIDFNSVYEYATLEYGKNFIGVYSISMGTMIVAKSSKINQLSFLICDSPVLNDSTIVERLLKVRGKIVLTEKVSLINEYDWKLITIPILIIASSIDHITTKQDGYRLMKMKPNRKIILYNCGHAQFLSCKENKDKITPILSFINKLL